MTRLKEIFDELVDEKLQEITTYRSYNNKSKAAKIYFDLAKDALDTAIILFEKEQQ